MREILFRGRRTDNDKWVEGFYLTSPEFDNIGISVVTAIDPRHPHYVFKRTVGQYTGLTDKNGKKIFEGDIVVYRIDEYGIIEYDEEIARFCVTFDTWSTDFDHLYGKELEVIGNIHDNPELLNESEDTE